VGNRRFRTIVTASLEEYDEASSKWAKSMVAAKLVGIIHSEGGRFLKQKKDNEDEWYQLSTQEAKAKVSHAIRDAIAAKEKTKANKVAASTSFDKVMGFHMQRQQQQLQQQQQQQQHQGMIGGPMHMGGLGNFPQQQAMMGGPSQPMMMMNSQNFLMNNNAMATPMFGMGMQQQNLAGMNHGFPDQMPPLPSQPGFVQTNTAPQFLGNTAGDMMGNNNAMMFSNNNSIAGMGTGMHPDLMMMMMPPRRHSQPPSIHGMAQPDMASSYQVAMVRNSMPPGGMPRSSVQDRLANVTVVRVPSAQSDPEESKKNNGDPESGGGDGDTEFLSLIDNVLGPESSKKKRGRRKSA
jgi:hypothetical protein